MSVPLFDITRQNSTLESSLVRRATEVIRSGRYILGPEVEAFEREVGEWLGISHCLYVSSGSDALVMAMMALDIGPGDEVILPAFTFFATAGCVHRLGARPVFADVCPVCFNLDCDSLLDRISPRTRAVIPVHLFGQTANMTAIRAICGDRGIAVVEDCAQSFGARHRGEMSGGLGTIGTFSFFPTKNLGGFGDSGLVTTTDEGLYQRLRRIRQHGMEPKYYHREVGGNFRGDPLQAAMLREKLPQVSDYLKSRSENAAAYHELLGRLPGVSIADEKDCSCPMDTKRIGADSKIVLPVAYSHHLHTWNQFTVRIANGERDSLLHFLREREIGCEVYYPRTLGEQECFQAHQPDPCPVSSALAGEVVSLPIFPELRRSEIEEVVAVIRAWLETP
ncbi:MAG: DegT/DnrJ/EryC1/StrS family aminotransferase [Puniceicoccaceae bacterium]